MPRRAAPPPIRIPGYRYHSPDIPLSAIKRFARQLGERFHPDLIILFGSYAYGDPHAGSDVDLLVIMPASSEVNQSIRMTLAFDPPFPLDLIVRTPAKIERRLKEGSDFLEEILTRGVVVYEEKDDSAQRGRSCPIPSAAAATRA